jgi:fructose transport system ATP-binding protein
MSELKLHDMGDIILETRDLTKHYGGVHALEGADFLLRKGEHVAIMGDNGAGKSTFVRQITGVEQPTRGRDWCLTATSSIPSTARLRRVKPGSKPCSRTLALADDLDVPVEPVPGPRKDPLQPRTVFHPRLRRRCAKRRWPRWSEDRGQDPELIRNTIRNMSGGQRQCVAIARTAAFKSKLVIMDEPTAALGRAGNRTGRKHHPHAERGRASR